MPQGRLRRGYARDMTQPAGHGLPDPRPGAEQRESMYRLAYEQGLRTLADQATELDGMRTRAVSFMAFVGTATAFLVTAALRSAEPGNLFFALALVATLCVGAAIVQLARLIRPGIEFTLRLDPRSIVTDWIDREVPCPSEALLLRGLSGWLAQYAEDNREGLKVLRNRFSHVIILGSSGLLIWTIAIWVFGRVGVVGGRRRGAKAAAAGNAL